MRSVGRPIHSSVIASQRLRQIRSSLVADTAARSTGVAVSRTIAAPAHHHTVAAPILQGSRHQSPKESISVKGSCCTIAKMSHMAATSGHQEACCNIPPVIDRDYTPKGSYEQLDNRKTYVTGPVDATIGIVSIFDIFGFMSQTTQGADLLASGSQKRKVFLADWVNGNPVPSEWFPPDTEEKQTKLGQWFGNNDVHAVATALPGYVEALRAAYPSITSWAILGYCWGGKVVELVTSAASNPFQAAAAVHPAMIDPAGADNISVPYILLAAGEDPVADVQAFESRLKVPNQVETFADQVHGFMAGRADLSNPRVKDEYTRGYNKLDAFFAKHLH